ncbi:site-specific recombinase [Neisseriaceae bacterium TC5R-5]|nr:site-specific recombinase [Neisseriaceae bacterium TC5R-5]
MNKENKSTPLEQALYGLSVSHSPLDSLSELIQGLRPSHASDAQQAVTNLQALSYLLEHQSQYRLALRNALLHLLTETRQIPLYTESGILANENFASALKRRIGERILPMPYKPDSLQDRFGRLFRRKDDYVWLAAIPAGIWQDLWRALAWHENDNHEACVQTRLQLLESVQVLSAQITAIGLEPELVRINPDIERFESPFLHLNAEVLRYVESYCQGLRSHELSQEDDKHILVLLEQCESILIKVRKNSRRMGISINLTYHYLRLMQNLVRIRALLAILEPQHDPTTQPQLFELLVTFARAENRQYSLRDLFKSNIELLALQVTEHAGRHGEHYIAESGKELTAMAKAAMGAGLVVGFMALIKLMLARSHLPLLWEGIAFGLNYAIGFIVVQMLHFTIATKQPAMTAARIATVLQQSDGHKQQLLELADLVTKVMRTQFVAILGNVLLVIPTAGLIAYAWHALFGMPVMDAAKAQHLLHEINPIASLALPHAAIAGVFLFLAGLIAGYYDNMAVYRRIPERIAEHPGIQRWLGAHRARKLGHYIEHNLGALAGNFYFGMFLGLTGTIGTILGLPLDIRHITFSAANLAFASVALDFQLPVKVMLLAGVGVALIGLTNLVVSFFLALWVALRSRKMSGGLLLLLCPLLLKQFLRRPWSFLLVPKSSQLCVETDRDAVVVNAKNDGNH